MSVSCHLLILLLLLLSLLFRCHPSLRLLLLSLCVCCVCVCVFPRQSPSFLLHINFARACLMWHSSISCPLSVDEFHVVASTLVSCRRSTINLPLDLTRKTASDKPWLVVGRLARGIHVEAFFFYRAAYVLFFASKVQFPVESFGCSWVLYDLKIIWNF